jgi:POT family proton-dependent oligopeptide transporter
MTVETAPTRTAELFGHPKGLSFLFATEMWERFSYYGMRALLVLYMVRHLLQPERAETVIGYGALRSGLETLFGPLGVQPLASHIYGFYTAFVYLTPVIGGLIADRWLGRRRTVVAGAVLMAIGHFMMAFEPLFLFALFMLILGNGAFKPNISCQVGTLYVPGDPRRDRAFSIFYVGINIGALFSPLVCGTLADVYGWHYGFAAAGIGMLIGTLIYVAGWPTLPPDAPALYGREAMQPKRPLDREEWRCILALAILFLPVALFWATYEQQGNTIALWADAHTDRGVNLLFWQGQIPTTWFQSFNPFMILAFTPFVIALWAWQARREREPSTVVKMALGCFGVALANLVLVLAAWQTGIGKASWLWLVCYFAIITIGELYLSPIGLSLVTKIAPARVVSMVMGLWLASIFVGNFISGWLGSFWSAMDKADFFLMIAAIAAGAGTVILAFNRPLRPIVKA